MSHVRPEPPKTRCCGFFPGEHLLSPSSPSLLLPPSLPFTLPLSLPPSLFPSLASLSLFLLPSFTLLPHFLSTYLSMSHDPDNRPRSMHDCYPKSCCPVPNDPLILYLPPPLFLPPPSFPPLFPFPSLLLSPFIPPSYKTIISYNNVPLVSISYLANRHSPHHPFGGAIHTHTTQSGMHLQSTKGCHLISCWSAANQSVHRLTMWHPAKNALCPLSR